MTTSSFDRQVYNGSKCAVISQFNGLCPLGFERSAAPVDGGVANSSLMFSCPLTTTEARARSALGSVHVMMSSPRCALAAGWKNRRSAIRRSHQSMLVAGGVEGAAQIDRARPSPAPRGGGAVEFAHPDVIASAARDPVGGEIQRAPSGCR